jgi:glycosyltransferase involved in cell wall biosynthesis
VPASRPVSNASGEGGLVSILTPSYNQARWLGDNLHSVAAQSYDAIEHIVADGGSTDGSLDILRSARPAVRWESEPDEGQSDAINKAFQRSSGEFIGWLNSDDAYYADDVVARAVRIFKRRPEIGVVYGHAALVNGSGEMLYILWTPPYARGLLRTYNFVYQPTAFVRRNVIRRPWFVDPAYGYMMDRELWLHLSGVTGFQRIDSIVAVDRHHLARKSYTQLDVARRDFARLRRSYGLPPTASNRLWRKAVKVSLRLAGLSKVTEARTGSNVLQIQAPPLPTLALRQGGQLRRWMPSGD